MDSADLLQFSGTNAADTKTINYCLINLISRLGLDLRNLKAFASDGASVMTGVNNGVAARLRENRDSTHMLNIYCICYHLTLACTDSSSQITVLKDFEDVLIQLWAFSRTHQRDSMFMLKPLLKCVIWTHYRRTSIKKY